MKFLIVGLGNIGPEYDQTRHNIGFMVLDEIAKENNLNFKLERYAFVAEMKHKGKSLLLLKPTTFMNLSGKAVNYWLQQMKTPLENILVITDDVAIPFGEVRLKKNGSSGGHNGLANIEQTLMSQNYPRLRVGIGNDYPKGGQSNYVLGRFNQTETASMPLLLNKLSNIVFDFCTLGIDVPMNSYNKKNLLE
ncbi:MAG: aminoacyl-tRNA hydrolase [Cytophagales bacterium]